MITRLELNSRQALELHKVLSSIPGTVAACDKFSISGVLRRIKSLGDWDPDIGAFRLLGCTEIELHHADGRKQTAPDGSVAKAIKYADEALASPFPDLRISAEERGAILRGLVAVVALRDNGCDGVSVVMEVAESLGMLDHLEARVYAQARPQPESADLA